MDLAALKSVFYPDAAERIADATRAYLATTLGRAPEGLTPDLAEGSAAYLRRGGKALRPVLLVLSAIAAGYEGDLRPLLPAAAAVETYHTATLVHDDIIDQDTLRRGAPTVHTLVARRHPELPAAAAAAHGVNTAIIAGDLLFGNSALFFASLDPACFPLQVILSILRRQAGVLNPGLLQGEQLDVELSFRPLPQVTLAEVEQMMRLKTGLLLAFAAECGAALGAATPIEDCTPSRILAEAASGAGIAFQIQDDILGLYGDERQLGKPIGSDLREGKRTLLVVEAWQKASPAARQLLETRLGNPDCDERDLAAVREVVEVTGALADNRQRAQRLIDETEQALAAIPDDNARRLLTAWADTLTRRNR